MLSISKARKKLGKLGKKMSDEQIRYEIELSDFLSELIIKAYDESTMYIKTKSSNKLE